MRNISDVRDLIGLCIKIGIVFILLNSLYNTSNLGSFFITLIWSISILISVFNIKLLNFNKKD